MNQTQQFCTFFLDKHWFGIPVEKVQEVLRYDAMTSVPLAPRDVCGLINLRGQIVMVIDLRRRLTLPDREPQQRGTHVIVQTGGETVSFLVDDMGDVRDVDATQFESKPGTIRGIQREIITGIYKLPERLLLALDVEKVQLSAKPLRDDD